MPRRWACEIVNQDVIFTVKRVLIYWLKICLIIFNYYSKSTFTYLNDLNYVYIDCPIFLMQRNWTKNKSLLNYILTVQNFDLENPGQLVTLLVSPLITPLMAQLTKPGRAWPPQNPLIALFTDWSRAYTLYSLNEVNEVEPTHWYSHRWPHPNPTSDLSAKICINKFWFIKLIKTILKNCLMTEPLNK